MQKFKLQNFSHIAVMSVAFLLVFDSSVGAQTIVPGVMPGWFTVIPSGASTYKIPISAPPGVAGMQPSLSLDYSSTSGNGIAGMGWSIGGSGAVTRCPKTLMHDGVRGTVNFDENDRFCLDGERLLLVSGSYGALNSEYRTEKDGFSQIVITAMLGGTTSPGEFRVKTKSGLTMKYGGTPSSSHFIAVPLSNSSAAASLALSSMSDVKGNTVSFTYADQRLTRVDYGSNVVEFVYETRADREERIQGPLRVVQDQRLSQVITSVPLASGMVIANTLFLTYHSSIETNRSMLSEVSLCAGPNDATRTCLKPTRFEWSHTSGGRPSQTWPSGVEFGTEAWELADLFGDGRAVYYSRNGTTHYARRLNEDGTSQSWKWPGGQSAFGTSSGFTGLVDLFGDGKKVFYSNDGFGNHIVTRFFENHTSQNLFYVTPPNYDRFLQQNVPYVDAQFLDLFADGRKVFHHAVESGEHRAYRFKLDQTVESFEWVPPYSSGHLGSTMADLFGDGRPMYYRFTQSGWHFASRFNSDQTMEHFTWYGGHSLPSNVEWTMADLFGEGRKMLYTRQGIVHQATRLSAKNSGGSAEKWQWTGLNPSAGGVRVADLFGGGRDVFYTFDKAGKHYANRFSPASLYPESFEWTETIGPVGVGGTSVTGSVGAAGGFFGSSPSTPWFLIDLQGEGRKIPYTRVGTIHYALKLFENNTMRQRMWDGHGEGDRGSTVGDLFGDGGNVYFTHNSGGQQFMTGLSTGFADLLAAVKPGGYWGNTPRQIDYSKITKPNIYIKDSNSVYPRADINMPLTVVSSVKVRSRPSAGDPDNETTYKYGGLKVDQQSGRGLLGFRWMEATEAATGITVRTEFMQDWPFIGLPKYSATTLQKSSVALLKQSDITYTSINTMSTGGSVCVATSPCFTYAQNTTEQSWDLNGAVLPLTTSTVAYDNYGNVTTMMISSSFAGQTSSKTATNTFKAPDLANWILGRIERATVTSTAPTVGLAAGIGVTPLLTGAPTTPSSTTPGVNLPWLPAIFNLLLN